ncbi:MAG: chemotaxis protein CheW [Candidatus Desulfatibia sp.]|uniref:chemotaxis protein CheA n=1 Tax=Candidatus Desulfatibia sp. TaxID=3101189 RepID=UPI002F32640C
MEDFSGFLNEFLEETEEHLLTLNSCLLEIEKGGGKGGLIRGKIDSLFRAAHTIKGLAGMIELKNIEELAHYVEDVLGEMRRDAIAPTPVVIDILFKSVDFLVTQINTLKTEGTDKNVRAYGLVRALKDVVEGNVPAQAKDGEQPSILEKIGIDYYGLGEAELSLIEEAYNAGQSIYEITKEFSGGLMPKRMRGLPVFKLVEENGRLIVTHPTFREIFREKGIVNCRVLFSSAEPPDKIKDILMDPVRVLHYGKSGFAKPKAHAGLSEILSSLDKAIIAEYLADVSELAGSIDRGLLILENDPSRTDILVNLKKDLNAIKGGSAMLGFSKISSLTADMTSFLASIEAKNVAIDSRILIVLFECTKTVRKLFDEIRQRKDTGAGIEREIGLLEGALGETFKVAGKIGELKSAMKMAAVDLDFLDDREMAMITEEHEKSLAIFDMKIFFKSGAIGEGHEPLVVLPIIEEAGNIIVRIPLIEDVPDINGFNADEFKMGFRFLFSSELEEDDIRMHIMKGVGIKTVELKEVLKKKDVWGAPVPDGTLLEVSREAAPGIPGVEKEKLAEKAKKRIVEKGTSTIRVDIERLDNLLNLVGELVTDRTRFGRITDELKNRNRSDPLSKQLTETNLLFQRHMNEIQGMIMSVRMVPIGNVFNRLPRMVRDLSKALGKKVEIEFFGKETELDKTLVEEISDPLMHIVRNSIDHGIETQGERRAAGKNPVGTIKLEAYQEGNNIVIKVSDDGRGLNIDQIHAKARQMGLITGEEERLSEDEIVHFIFEPSFTTAEITTKISGRGVGMDVVKKNIIKLKGLIDVHSEPGKGATFLIRLPLTLAIIPALMVGVGEETFAVPLSAVVESIRITPAEIRILHGREMIDLRGSVMPLLRLGDYFQLHRKRARGMKSERKDKPRLSKKTDAVFVVVVGIAEKRLGLVVDELFQQQEIVIKNIGSILKDIHGIAGASIMGNGEVALIIDVGQIIEEGSRQETTAAKSQGNME